MQLDWFAGHCWNAAISAATDKHWQAAAALFASTAAYHSARQSPNTDQLTRLTVLASPSDIIQPDPYTCFSH